MPRLLRAPLLGALLIAVLLTGPAVASATSITLIDPASGFVPGNVNNTGRVVGHTATGIAYWQAGVVRPLSIGTFQSGFLFAGDDAGRMFGNVFKGQPNPAQQAAWWDAAGGIHVYPAPAPGESTGFDDVSPNGRALGTGAAGTGAFSALPPAYAPVHISDNSRGVSINARGHYIVRPNGQPWTFFNGVTTTVLPADFVPKDLNGKDEIAGSGSGVTTAPKLRRADGTIVTLPVPADALASSQAAAMFINDDGLIAGRYFTTVGVEAWVYWRDGVVHPITALLPNGSGLSDVRVTALSNRYLVGNGLLAGVRRDFLLSLDTCTAPATPLGARVTTCAPADGLDYKVDDRLSEFDHRDVSGGQYGSAERSYIYPKQWPVDLFLTSGGVPFTAEDCTDPNVQWRWTVSVTKNVKRSPKPGCETSMAVSRLGKYKLTARRYTRAKTGAPWKLAKALKATTVEVKDWLIVGMGDSNASGEGNPPFMYQRCNRSSASYQFQSALYLEQQDPHSSVTFVWTACSGARIKHLIDHKYSGTRPKTPWLPPQMDQVQALLIHPHVKPRKIDFALVSIGVNDLSFGPAAEFCVEHPWPKYDQCVLLKVNYFADDKRNAYRFVANAAAKGTVGKVVGDLQNKLGGRFKALAAKVDDPLRLAEPSGLGISPRKVLLAAYPDFSRDENGKTCDTTLLSASIARWQPETWAWFGRQADILDGHVKAAGRYRFQTTPSSPEFLKHGYCAGDHSFIRGAIVANLSDDAAGPFHPTEEGHLLEAEMTQPRLCKTLYRNTTCTGKWR